MNRSYFPAQDRFFTFEITCLWQVISREALAKSFAQEVFALYDSGEEL